MTTEHDAFHMMTSADFFHTGERVMYIPLHAHGDQNHHDVETGTVSSVNAIVVFVKFDKQLAKFGWDGTTSQACDPRDLIPLT